MNPYFVKYIGKQPKELKGIITYTSLPNEFVIVETDQNPARLIEIKGVTHVERADTARLL